MMNNEIIAYEGKKFTIEWYYNEQGKSQALNYYKCLSANERAKLLYLFKRMGDLGEINDKTKFNYEGDQIYAFKPQPERYLCFFFEGSKIVITNAFKKKQQKLPINEKNKALQCKKNYTRRYL
jgi:hypothetical protein